MNDHASTKLSVIFLCLTAFLSSVSVASAADSKNHRRVNDVDFYLAVIPAEITQGPAGMQSRFKNHETRYHIIVSIFDSQTGNRITDAKVQASVNADGGMSEQYKSLEPMLIMDASSYGNYFLMSEPGVYRLRFKMLAPERKYEVIAEFSFDRPGD